MDLQTHTYTRMGHELAFGLRAQIQSGELSVGSRLPTQRALASRWSVGRQAVQEALGLLESEGYMITKRGAHGGSFVCEPVAPAAVWMELARSNLSDLEDALDFRVGVEMQIAVLAAARRSDDDLLAMREAIDALRTAKASRSHFREADGRFHFALARAAGNSRLESALRRARADLFLPTDNIPYNETIEVSRRQHLAIHRAVERQNPAAAARAVSAHIEETRRHLRSLVSGGE
jgi:GntR family transcriptional repressor for pyruvate dehydrogenase complex